MTNLKTRLEGHQEGFTLVELLIVVLIIGILAAIAIPVFNGQRNKAKNSQAKSMVRNALSAGKAYFAENETYAGLNHATLLATESSIPTIPAGINNLTPTGADPPNRVLVTGGTGFNATTRADPDSTTAIFCALSSGDEAYCIRDANGTVTYAKGSGTPGAISTGTFTASW